MRKELKLFNDYVSSNFYIYEPKIRYKIDHTFRVVEIMERLAKKEDFSKDEIELAKICALFHDIGRFSQTNKYNTYIDRESFDHGDKAVEVLKELGYNNEIVIKAAKYHNKYALPDNLSKEEMKFASITRDADKIDILRYQRNEPPKNKDVISKEILNCFRNKKQINNEIVDRNNETDLILRGVSHIYDINYKEAIRIIDKDKTVSTKLENIKRVNNSKEINEIISLVNEYIKERMN